MKTLPPVILNEDDVQSSKDQEQQGVAAEVRSYEDVTIYISGQLEFLYCLFKDPPAPTDLDLWARCLTVMALHFRVFLNMTYIFFAFEVGRTPDSFRTGGSIEKTRTFLRQTTVLSKILDSFSQTHSKEYICTVAGPIVKFFLTEYEGPPVELDESRVSEEQLNASGEVLLEVLEKFLKAFEDAIDGAPYYLRLVCQQIAKIGARCNGDASFMISSYLMLRCLTPSLVVPERYGILDALDLTDESFSNPGCTGRRSLIAFSRVLQKFVNKTRFEETNCVYLKLNRAFEKESGRLKSLLLRFASPETVQGSPIRPFKYSTPTPHQTPEAMKSVLSSCHLVHIELHHAFSCLFKHIGHLSPLADSHFVPQKLLALLPPPPPQLTFSLIPKQNFVHYLRHETDPDPEDLVERYRCIMQEAHRPLGVVADSLNAISRTRYLNVCGMNRERTTVIQLTVGRMPADYSDDRNMLLFFAKLMDGISRSPYIITFITDPHLGYSAVKPAYNWLRKIYESDLPRKYTRNLRAMYILYPTFWIKGMLGMLHPIGGRNGVRLGHIQSLPSLVEELKIDPRRFPAAESLIKSCGGVAAASQIGLKFEDVMRRADQQNRDYPTLPYQCIQWVGVHGLSSREVFTELNKSTEEVDESGMGQLDLPGLGLPKVVWLLMQFMQQIPGGGVFGPQVMELCSAGADLCLPEGAIAQKEPATARVSNALLRLPPEHLSLACDFFLLLHHVFLTGLSASTLAEVIVAFVFPPPVSYSKKPPQPTQGEITLTKFMIAQPLEFWDTLWCKVDEGL